ncbi:hypothetical protein HDU88_007803 [Geranomyces variabilis]|nr:hypothetical protein HDU88_007803 [Geranomyces variabilis]
MLALPFRRLLLTALISTLLLAVLWLSSSQYDHASGSLNLYLTGQRTLVVYVYYDGTMTQEDAAIRGSWKAPNGFSFTDANTKSPPQTANLQFFLRHGLMSNVDHLFVMNSPIPKSVKFPQRSNIYVWEKENKCYDLGSFGQGVEYMQQKYGKKYTHYILLNASVRGPFRPTYVPGCWSDAFLSKLSPEVRMVGTTVYCLKSELPRHVQTMIVAFDQQGFEAGKPAFGCPPSIQDAIRMAEVPLTGHIEKAGYRAEALITSYQADPDLCGYEDMNYKGKYFGMSFHPYELVFIKTNRGIDDHAVAQYTEWHDKLLATRGSQCPYHIPLPAE